MEISKLFSDKYHESKSISSILLEMVSLNEYRNSYEVCSAENGKNKDDYTLSATGSSTRFFYKNGVFPFHHEYS